MSGGPKFLPTTNNTYLKSSEVVLGGQEIHFALWLRSGTMPKVLAGCYAVGEGYMNILGGPVLQYPEVC